MKIGEKQTWLSVTQTFLKKRMKIIEFYKVIYIEKKF